jgi:5-methylcytosine-specific restriction endonuclease McrA
VGYTGKDNPNWHGGIKTENKKIRDSDEYVAMRQYVMKRDNYTCVSCGQIGGKLFAHHWFPFSIFVQYRIDADNMTTLCEKCHRKLDFYLRARYA